MGAYSRAAYVVKPKSLNGWVVCHAADDLPFSLQAGMTVHFVPPVLRGPRTAKVAEVRSVREGVWEARFEGIDTIDDAQKVSGCYCLADAGEVARAGVKVRSAVEQMLGYTLVEATAGEVGTIVAIQPGPAQDWLVVAVGSDEVMVPAVDAFLGPVDHEEKRIHATLPPGLLDVGRRRADLSDTVDEEDQGA